jgi:hypothetical protein
LFGVTEHLASVVDVGEGLADVARDNGGVVEVVEKPPTIFSEDNLLFSTLNGGCKVQVVATV